ncbi:hypothetical protein KCU73_g17235, partial [Aureobasidium melanogenum]
MNVFRYLFSYRHLLLSFPSNARQSNWRRHLIQSPDNCAADLQNQNPTVMQAYTGFVAYQSLYHAGCLLNSNTGSYCFSDAVTNASSPTDSYVYYLPLGISLPSTTSPSCSSCLRDTMSVFASTATNRSQPLSKVYGTAAAMID